LEEEAIMEHVPAAKTEPAPKAAAKPELAAKAQPAAKAESQPKAQPAAKSVLSRNDQNRFNAWAGRQPGGSSVLSKMKPEDKKTLKELWILDRTSAVNQLSSIASHTQEHEDMEGVSGRGQGWALHEVAARWLPAPP
jgi:hypothetical protein